MVRRSNEGGARVAEVFTAFVAKAVNWPFEILESEKPENVIGQTVNRIRTKRRNGRRERGRQLKIRLRLGSARQSPHRNCSIEEKRRAA